MQKKICFMIMLVALLTVVTATSSRAACALINLVGNWNFYTIGWDDADEGWFEPYWAYGPLTVTSTGAINTGTSIRTPEGEVISFTGGKLAISSACTVSGTIKLGSGVGTITIKNAAMDSGKTVVTGVYTITDGSKGLFNLLKR